ncbi:MAG TPA: DUF3024 domain-containing protein [Gammaproteobacteria bacterium]|nr:DUF3024 domain-containing protein [Gammaproteobacteria bacterium]
MSVESLEFQRARRLLDTFCTRRNTAGNTAALSCRQQDNSLLLIATEAHSATFRTLVKLDYRDNHWSVFWPREDGSWQPWPHLPETDSVQFILDELEQAPLHVHW